MFEQIKNFLNQPYPDKDDLKSTLWGALILMFIVAFVLAVFTPFGLSSAGNAAFKYAAIFGLISGTTSIIVDLFFRHVLKLQRDVPEWKFWKWILYVLFLIIMITLANYSFMVLTFESGGMNFTRMIYSTFVVGIFPVMIFGSLNLVRNIKTYQLIAEELNIENIDIPASANVSLPIKNSKKTFEIDPSQILYLEAMQNYVLIHYLDENQQYQKETHRNTITAMEQVLRPEGIKRTHRSYLVNPNMIESVTGNAQGLKLALKYAEAIVPVSRKYLGDFR